MPEGPSPGAEAETRRGREADGGGSPQPRASKRWMRLTVFAVALSVTTTMGMGTGALLAHAPPAPATVPLAFYITDAPAQLTAFDVKIASVTTGPGRVPLQVMQSSFDLAALQGPGAAILLARGDVPSDAVGAVEVTFASARATVDGHTFDVPLAQTLVVEGLESPSAASPAFLIDVDLPSSLAVGPDGRLHFAPVTAAVLSGPSPVSGAAPAWTPVQATAVTHTGLESAGIAVPSGHDWAVRDPSGLPDGNRSGDGAVPGDPGGLETPATPGIPDATPGWLVSFHDNTSSDDMRLLASDLGAAFVTSLHSLPVAYVLATPEQAEAMADHPRVERVEADVPIQYHDMESRAALRLPDLRDPVDGLHDAQGRPIDGRGIGVAVVDTGIDGTHPAFVRPEVIHPAIQQDVVGESAVADNRKVVHQAFVPLPNTDTTSGHGTHVAAIVAGQVGSDEALPGVAPGATLYGLGVGESRSIIWAAQAFDWILQNHDQVDPPIRVVTNSWGSSAPYNPDSAITRLVDRMVQEGIVVVFSASNRGGDGSTAETSAQCQIPTPGVVCVAAYDDLGTGTRDGEIADFSSRGRISDSATWPDISAPGSDVRSARTLAGAVTGVGFYRYVELSGTSQAAPHVAGVVALMLQMNGSLSPASVEMVLKESAHPFSDGGAYTQDGHHAKGHGLVDAHAAVAQAG